MLLDIYSKNDASIIYPGLLAIYMYRYVFSLLSKHPQGTIVINMITSPPAKIFFMVMFNTKLLYPPLTASH